MDRRRPPTTERRPPRADSEADAATRRSTPRDVATEAHHAGQRPTANTEPVLEVKDLKMYFPVKSSG